MPNRVLVVDDCADTATSLSALFQLAGYDARAVTRGDTALTVVPEFEPCVVVTDLKLPGLSGEGLVARLVAAPGHRPKVVVLSGLMDYRDTRDRLLALGVTACLTKPADPAALLACVRRLCA